MNFTQRAFREGERAAVNVHFTPIMMSTAFDIQCRARSRRGVKLQLRVLLTTLSYQIDCSPAEYSPLINRALEDTFRVFLHRQSDHKHSNLSNSSCGDGTIEENIPPRNA